MKQHVRSGLLMQLTYWMVGMMLSLQVHAAPVSWTLNGTVLDQQTDMGTGVTSPLNVADQLKIEGSFSYDASNLDTANPNVTFSLFDFFIKDALGTVLYHFDSSGFDAKYTPDPVTPLPALTLLSTDPANKDALILEFASSLNSGSVASLTYALFSTGAVGSVVQYVSSGVGGASNGSVSAVPVPAAGWLFATGLFGLVRAARRKQP